MGTELTGAFSPSFPLPYPLFSYSATVSGLTPGQYWFEFMGYASPNSATLASYSLTLAPVPEPETYALLLAGLGLVGFIARRRKAGVSTLSGA